MDLHLCSALSVHWPLKALYKTCDILTLPGGARILTRDVPNTRRPALPPELQPLLSPHMSGDVLTSNQNSMWLHTCWNQNHWLSSPLASTSPSSPHVMWMWSTTSCILLWSLGYNSTSQKNCFVFLFFPWTNHNGMISVSYTLTRLWRPAIV